MKIYAICPVVDKNVNERVTRTNALFTVLFVFAFTLTSNIFFIVFLGIDFYFRTSDFAKYSPFAFASKRIVKFFNLENISINAGPKLFAARIGMLLCVFILISYFFKVQGLVFAFAAILGFFALLETAFGICVACQLYPYIYKFLYKE